MMLGFPQPKPRRRRQTDTLSSSLRFLYFPEEAEKKLDPEGQMGEGFDCARKENEDGLIGHRSAYSHGNIREIHLATRELVKRV